MGRPAATEGKKLASQRRRFSRRRLDLGQIFMQLASRHGFAERYPAVRGDDCQHVVEVVSDTARQLSEGVHLLRLGELFVPLIELGPREFFRGEVVLHQYRANQHAVNAAHRGYGRPAPDDVSGDDRVTPNLAINAA